MSRKSGHREPGRSSTERGRHRGSGVPVLRPEEVSAELGLPPRLQAAIRERIRLLTLFALLSYALSLVLLVVARSPGGALFTQLRIVTLVVSVALALVVFVTARRLPVGRAMALILILEWLACLSISVTGARVLDLSGLMLPINWVTPIIIMVPLLIPTPPRWTLITSVACALTAPAGILVAHALGIREFGRLPLACFFASVSPAVAAVIAYLGGTTVYDLGLRAEQQRRAGSYVLGEKLGEGGMGEVYVANHVRLPRPAAIKFIRPEQLEARFANRDVARRRFEREAGALARLQSPHTVELFDFDLDDRGRLFFVMELLDGWNSNDLVQEFGPLSAPRVVYLVSQACHALEEAHRLGMVHRDVKPSNLMVCRMGLEFDFVKVMDFGILTTPEGEEETGGPGVSGTEPDRAGLTLGSLVMGTPDFMSPEQVRREHLDGRSDVYCLGLVAYYLLTGTYVFRGGDPRDKMRRQMEEAPEPPSARVTGIPAAVEAVILTALAKDRNARPASAEEFASRLAAAVGSPWTPPEAEAWWQEHRPAPKPG